MFLLVDLFIANIEDLLMWKAAQIAVMGEMWWTHELFQLTYFLAQGRKLKSGGNGRGKGFFILLTFSQLAYSDLS